MIQEQLKWIRERNRRCDLDNKQDVPVGDLKPSWNCMMDWLIARKSELVPKTPQSATANSAGTPSVSALVQSAKQVDPGIGLEIRGVKLGMRAGHLPAEFNSLPVQQSGELQTARVIHKCEKDETGIESCLTIYFDVNQSEMRIFAIRLNNLQLGTLNDPAVAVKMLTEKFGPPAQQGSTGQGNGLPNFGNMLGGPRTYLQWNAGVDITKTGGAGITMEIIANPIGMDRLVPGFAQQDRTYLAEIGPLLRGGAWVQYANIVALDIQLAIRNRLASEQKVRDIQEEARRREFERAPKPRL
jgi:hypothetical protein